MRFFNNNTTIVIENSEMLKVSLYGKTYLISFTNNILGFLLQAQAERLVDIEMINKYDISQNLQSFFLKIGIILNKEGNFNNQFEQFVKAYRNPSNLLIDISGNELHKIYQKNITSFSSSIKNFGGTKIIGEKFNKININEIDLQLTHSYRGTKKFNKYSEEDLLSITRSIFYLSNNKNGLSGSYGSGGGFYSVRPIIFTSRDNVYIYDKRNDVFNKNYFPGLFVNITKEGYVDYIETNLYLYDFLIVLCVNPRQVVSKYGNRGFKYILMEAGSIGSLYRIYCFSTDKKYIEIQGYYEGVIEKYISKIGVSISELSVLHSIFSS